MLLLNNDEYASKTRIISRLQAAQKQFEKLEDTILSKKTADTSADTSQEEITIDRLVYELYGLFE